MAAGLQIGDTLSDIAIKYGITAKELRVRLPATHRFVLLCERNLAAPAPKQKCHRHGVFLFWSRAKPSGLMYHV